MYFTVKTKSGSFWPTLYLSSAVEVDFEQSISTADESQCWLKAPLSSHHNLYATQMSTDVNQVGVALFPSF